MTLLPEQLRALSYAHKRGTNAPLDSIQTRVASTYAEFEAMVDAVPPELAREHRTSSLWSVQEVVDHLVQTDRRAVEQLAQLLAGQSVDTPIPASLQSSSPLALDWAALLCEFHNVHQDIFDLLAAAADDLLTVATAPVQMVVKCVAPDGTVKPVSWVERFNWKAFSIVLHAHNREHIAQVQRILNAPSIIRGVG
jgi:hypothetical protein